GSSVWTGSSGGSDIIPFFDSEGSSVWTGSSGGSDIIPFFDSESVFGIATGIVEDYLTLVIGLTDKVCADNRASVAGQIISSSVSD
ncbi:MAG: hypothetical protein COX30_04425, partial [Candidatus Moranbacteria bacterium CG23_combo_of_CG06-09_8_20_14_all_39_10]